MVQGESSGDCALIGHREHGEQDDLLLQVDFPMRHVAETAPFLTPPLDLDENEHASRRISTPPVTMGLSRESRSDRLTDLV